MSKSEPRSVGPYTLEETLGRGQTGLVKLGLHCTTKKKVAVKIIDRSKLSEQVLSKVEREIAVMKLIEHPHVMGLYDVYENKRHLFLVLEHVSGGELFDYLVKKGKLPLGEARRYFAQITSAVDFCHRHCVCHRDLKPENLLLDKKMNIKVADFGMASLQAGDNTLLETSCGSPHYACPEVIRGEKYDGRKADIWSCGVILYALLVGALPFDDEHLRNLLEKVKRGHFKIPNYIPPDIQQLIRGMITVNPEKRLTMEEVRKHPFLLCCTEELPSTPYGVDVIVTDTISSKDEIDPDVLGCMASLGCFKNKEKLIRNLLKHERTMERVIYFLLLERKERTPCSEDEEVASSKNIKGLLEDPPRKRVDSCGSPRLLRAGPRMSPNHSSLTRPRAETVTGANSHRSPLIHVSPKHQLHVPPQGSPDPSPPESPSHSTPPGSPWKSRFSNIKNAIVGSPRFHRKGFTSVDDSETENHHSPETSPDVVRRSWFGHLMIHSSHKHEPFFIVIKDRPFNTVKADVVHAFLSVSHLTHCVLSQNSFRAEYKKIGGNRIFKKAVKVLVEITSTGGDCEKENLTHTVSITLEAGPAHRFKRLCEKLQTILFSDVRKHLAEEKRRESDDKCSRDEEDSSTGKLRLAHLSDTDSDGDL